MTKGARTAERPDARTVASVGDRPLPTVTGEPGSSVAADVPTQEPKRNPGTRISGRVIDEAGRPVANATVRPAQGSTSVGRVVQATTDRAGGFTLQGLRANTDYTLIAEYETDEGIKTGRIDVRSADTGVEIALDPLGGSRLGAGDGRARSISNREALDDEEIPPPRGKAPRVNLDDIPTSDEIEAGLSTVEPRRAKSVNNGGWKGRTDDPAVRSSSRTQDEPSPAGPAPSRLPSLAPEDDGENPLPPAIDPTERETPAPKTSRAAPPRPRPDVPSAGASELTASANSGGFRLARPEEEPAPQVAWDRPTRQREAAPAEPPPMPVAKRTTWEDVLAVAPPLETRPRVAAASTAPRGSPPRSPAGPETVRFDARSQRLNDFRLPDTQGRLVSFQDIDADYVLLDFWGSWCRPCVESIPHLVDVQKRYGDGRVKVVGVACEKGSFQQRAGKAAEAAQKLGVNYPVLVSSAEDYSPVQDALKIRSFPTLILVDRQGRIVWREQGAAPVTLARLDRVLDSSTRSDTVRR